MTQLHAQMIDGEVQREAQEGMNDQQTTQWASNAYQQHVSVRA